VPSPRASIFPQGAVSFCNKFNFDEIIETTEREFLSIISDMKYFAISQNTVIKTKDKRLCLVFLIFK